MYDKEFKLNAIRFYEESGKKLRDVEEELGIGAGCLSHWRKELREEKAEAFRGNGNMTEEQKELVRLRRENEILKEEREILKKVVGMFSKPSK
ncbi:MAG: transposase [Bacteroidetes bacterium]|nr:transposase [Bacteroidota bacterium]